MKYLFFLVSVFFVGSLMSAAEPPLKSGIDKANFDMSVKPGIDFYDYVDANWNKNNPIPPEYTRWGAFSQLQDESLIAMRTILEGLSNIEGRLGPDARKLRDFYATAMDEKKLKEQGLTPLAGDLETISKLKQPDELLPLVAHLHINGVSAVFSFSVHQDEKLSTRYVSHLRQGGLGLPDRDYYLGKTEDSKKIRDEYRQHVEKMLGLLGDAPEAASTAADAVLKIETQLAEAARTPVQLRDREANYNKKTLAELGELTPNLHWHSYLTSLYANPLKVDDVVVGQPEFL